MNLLALAAENKSLSEDCTNLTTNNVKLSEEYSKLILQYEDLQRTTAQSDENDKANDKESNVHKVIFSCKTLKISDYQYYTGFSFDRYHKVFKYLVPSDKEEPFTWTKTVSGAKAISLEDQFLLVMMKLRQNFDFIHLSHLFGLSSQDCSTLFFNWINYMFFRLGSLVVWPHRDEIINNMPTKYKVDFPDTVVIIDGTELKIQKPSALNRQSQCYSDYKSCTTLKGLVGVDPRGSVMFASMLFSGSISDKVLTKESGFLNILHNLIQQQKVKRGDGIMADKGFLIEDEIKDLGLKLNIPPFATKGVQMKPQDVLKTIKIAKHRVHVERAIARIKQFKILSGKISLSLFGCINQIWLVCCLLTNFMPFLIQD